MAGRGYMITPAYSSYTNGAVSPDDEEHSRLGYVEYECIGDVCRPVSGNADRGNHPLAFLNSATPAKYVVTKIERVVERSREPVMDYGNHYAAHDYGAVDKNYEPENYDVVDLDRDHKFTRNDYGDTKYKEKAYDLDHDRKFPMNGYGGRRYRPETYEYDSDLDRRPRKVEEFISKIQDDVAQPIVRYSVASKTQWPASASPAFTGRDSPTRYGFSGRKLEDNPSKDRKTRNEYYPDNQTWKSDSFMEPTTPASTGIRPTNYMPNRVRLSAPLNQAAYSKTNLSAATNDINTAMEYLMRATNPSSDLVAASTSPQRRSAVPPVLKTDSVSDSSGSGRGSHYIQEKQGYGYFNSPHQKVPAEQRRYVATSK